MLHATTYTNSEGDGAGAFLEAHNCLDDDGATIVYAKRFDNIAMMQRTARELQDLYCCGVVYRSEIEPCSL